ncbi:MAG: Pr6Pr family membrane protein [Nocardioides sp.]|nr:Pr6Pr family membrane protein [Nocardioides sp.]
MPPRSDLTRRAHAVLAVLTLVALVLQFVLVVQDAGILIEQDTRPDLDVRLARFFSYFTVQANVLVFLVSAAVARGSDIARPMWQAVRLSTLTGIIVTGVVHWVALRPLLDLSGGPWLADKLLHVAVPLVAVVAWLAVGPHGLGPWRRVAQALIRAGRLGGVHADPRRDHRLVPVPVHRRQ